MEESEKFGIYRENELRGFWLELPINDALTTLTSQT